MAGWTLIALLVVALLVVAALATATSLSRRARELEGADEPLRRETFIPAGELSPGQRARYRDSWRRVEATYARDPEAGVARADHALRQLAADLGYPVDLDRRLAAAQAIVELNERTSASERDLSRAMHAYRATFAKLADKGRPDGEEATFTFREGDSPRRRD